MSEIQTSPEAGTALRDVIPSELVIVTIPIMQTREKILNVMNAQSGHISVADLQTLTAVDDLLKRTVRDLDRARERCRDLSKLPFET